MAPLAARLRLGRLSLVSMEPQELFEVTEPGLRHVVTVNAEIFVMAHERPAYEAVLAHTWNVIDGRPVQWLARVLNPGPPPRKLAGSDLLEPLAAFCRDTNRGLFLLGASEDVNAIACDRLRQRLPGLTVHGYAPPLSDDVAAPAWNDTIFRALEPHRPHALVVAFGPPKTDYWIDAFRPRLEDLGVRFAAGFGGTLKFVAELVPRAPAWVQWAGFEWLFRAVVEPGRWRRTARLFWMPYYALARRSRG